MILGIQTALALRLVWSNTPFTDEALYLWAGHLEIAHLLHGSAVPEFSSSFSGAPVIYPVLGAAADTFGGLAGARILSLCFMLGATTLLWATTRRLYGNLAAFFAAASWAVIAPTLHLSAFATYDAMAMLLIALAAWFATARRADDDATIWMVAAGVTLAAANATAYSTAIIDPIIVLLAIFSAWPEPGGKAALRRGALLSVIAFTAGYGSLWLAGGYYQGGFDLTVLNRVTGTQKASLVLSEAFQWTGAVVIIAIAGVLLAAAQRRDRHNIWFLGICASAAILVPIEQARIHTDTSLDKHVDIGAWFVAIAVGYAISKLITISRPYIIRIGMSAIALAGVAMLAVAALPQARQIYAWPNDTSYVATLRPLVARTHGPLMIESEAILASQVPAGYDWQRWSDTYAATLPNGKTIGYAAGKANTQGTPTVFEALIRQEYFSLIAISYDPIPFNEVILAYLKHDSHYHLITTTRYGSSVIPIWKRVS
jgi:4-amino-4-deoxy-L-arabinose transferase-like glycosyltransferase